MTAYKMDLETYQYTPIITTQTGYNPEDFITDQIWFTSKDGTEVPAFVIRKKSVLPSIDSEPKKPLLTMLYAYGSHGVSQTPKFSPINLVLLKDLNAVVVVANIRGGGEFGDEWRKAAIQEKKQTSFDDFISAAEFLIQKNITDNKHLFI